jgi:hypothetical protein
MPLRHCCCRLFRLYCQSAVIDSCRYPAARLALLLLVQHLQSNFGAVAAFLVAAAPLPAMPAAVSAVSAAEHV